MGNSKSARASREEEIAFLAIEQVLGVDVRLADAGSGDRQPDGLWTCDGDPPRVGIVEVTSPPATKLMNRWAADKRAGRPQGESGMIDSRLGDLGGLCADLLDSGWARENISKLLGQSVDERHLFLFARGYDVGNYFYRLSDVYDDGSSEHVDALALPDGITDVWLRGRARRDRAQRLGNTEVRVARFQAGSGWHRYLANIEEQHLPSPNAAIADDEVPEGWRNPKDRRVCHGA